MKQSKKLVSMLVVLAVVLVATVFVLTYEEKKEEIKNSGETILQIAKDDVTGIAWKNENNELSFSKEEKWVYDGDDAFPVDADKLTALLHSFEELNASFEIENVDHYGQYGLENPEYSITLDTKDKTYEIRLGDFSSMDSERYISIGDGSVYLVADDPAEDFDIALDDLMEHDVIPEIEDATELAFTGMENYSICLEETSITYDEEDLYYADRNGKKEAVDSEKIEAYLNTIKNLSLTNYKTYAAEEGDLEEYGLNNPELTITVKNREEDEDGEMPIETFSISVGRNPEEVEKAEEEEEVPAYVRVGESNIIYEITFTEYESLTASSYNDLCHQQIFWADFSSVTELTVGLEGEEYTFLASGKSDDRVYKYKDKEIEMDEVKSSLLGMTVEEFTNDSTEGKEEIRLTIELDNENVSSVEMKFYRHDGSTCLAVVDGENLAFVSREHVVDLIEAVNAVVLNN